jgi:hypothetical protein
MTSGENWVDGPERRLADLRAAAYHENAHAVVAQLEYGVHGWRQLEANPKGGSNEKHFAGRFVYSALTMPNGTRARRAIGLAGIVAEELMHGDYLNSYEIEWSLAEGTIELSATDAELARGYSGADIKRSIRLVKKHWTEISRLAEADVAMYSLGIEAPAGR